LSSEKIKNSRKRLKMFFKILDILSSEEFDKWYQDFKLYYVMSGEWNRGKAFSEVMRIFRSIK